MLDPVRPASKPPEQDDAFRPSLPEVYASVHVPSGGRWIRRFLAFAGPGYMISVGYMDPGNWATDLAGGSRFGYTLLAVILLSNLMAILLQALAVRLGVATGRDLAQACRDHYSKPVNFALWLACETAIIACDLAEVIGTAIALNLLFGIPLIAGALLTALDAFLLLLLMNKGFRLLEAFVITLLIVIAGCFTLQIVAAAPPFADVLRGFVPSPRIVADREMLYVAIGILGATVMPHNLYLHSSVVQTRAYGKSEAARRDAIRWATIDSTIALTLALFINAAILIVAAAVFHASGHEDVAEIGDAFRLLSPLLGLSIASTLFAVALLASGLNSTVTATLAGQIVMEGFLRLRIPNWARRLITRAIAIVPVIVVTAIYGEKGTAQLLVLSQVILSMQLPFAVIPLVRFVSDRRKMGVFVISRWTAALAWLVAGVIVVLNVKLLADTLLS
ncbi:divalent metal cation transporter MntH (plasmid) [Burkholderia sp. SFA1]|uniref:Nramp family divalent metal transporter n=1 Tax=unclassified Caballeronia TaxID=2646786 RepID=UPI001F20C124|nr:MULTISPECIES: Nramp family divalent metal transporter [unclassified Caballeronia]MCE4546168.1 Nramp family divalent metal transporter [Caballeronia sp. PC1]MCE4573357.1 Nramp family divalent metal transporter [Caballeronia sp. CLC5]BBQ01450.1 divalent metal cation transporter MntH [Burkholderia sp. SFA1]